MILTAEYLTTAYDEFRNQDEKILDSKLNALELMIRKYTNNNFQNRNVRFSAESLGDRLLKVHPFLRVGDTVQITESKVNDGLFVITEITDDFIRLDKKLLFNIPFNLVTKVEYPDDIKEGIINLLRYELTMRDKTGIKSESISRHSVTYYDMNSENQVMGYPVSLFAFLTPYKKARF